MEQGAPEPSCSNSENLSLSFLNRLSVFETVRAYGGVFFHLAEHWQRLEESCAGLGQHLPLEADAMSAWIDEVLQASGYSDAMVRVSIHWDREGEGVIAALVREFKSYPKEWYQAGVAMKTAVLRRPSLKADNPQIKCSQYAGGVLATLDESGQKAHELLFLGDGGYIAEGTVSNLFIIKKKRVLTPSVGSGILSGVTRAFVIELCRQRGLEVLETFFTRHEIYNADECFMTNTSSEILPVVKLDGRLIGPGLPGPVTKILADDFQRVRMQTKGEIND